MTGCDRPRTDFAPSVGKYILRALTEKSQANNQTAVIIGSDGIAVTFYISSAVSNRVASALRADLQQISSGALKVLNCGTVYSLPTKPEPNCSAAIAGVAVIVPGSIGEFNRLLETLPSSPRVAPLKDLASDATQLTISTALQLGKPEPVCVYGRLLNGRGMVAGGVIVVLTSREQSVRGCFLSSLYRIAGVEPFPDPIGEGEEQLSFLLDNSFGPNPATALRFRFEGLSLDQSTEDLSREVDRWIAAQGD